jgi:hypothetical protein
MAVSQIDNNGVNLGQLGNRNLIINSAMQVAQRGTSATGVTTNGYRTCDRFQLLISDMGTYTVTQESDAPAGFANSFKVNPTTADASPSAGDYLFVAHKLEGQNLQQLQKGTASAKPVTLSFWVKSYQTGTFQVNMRDEDNARQIGATYNVDSSGVWEYKEITFSGDTTGAFDNDANESSKIEWWLDSGTTFSSGNVPSSWTSSANGDRNAGSTVNLANNTANYWQITGIQLEVGDIATPFEYRSYGDELARCQRYYQVQRYSDYDDNEIVATGVGWSSGLVYCHFKYPAGVTMRARPTCLLSGDFLVLEGGTSSDSTENTVQGVSYSSAEIRFKNSIVDLNSACWVRYKSGSSITLDAEL